MESQIHTQYLTEKKLSLQTFVIINTPTTA